MRISNLESYGILRRLLTDSARILGIPASAGAILATLYFHGTQNNQPVSTEDINIITGLSRSSISLICMRLESIGIISKALDGLSKRQGRRRISYSLRVGLDEILRLGIQKYVVSIRSTLEDFRNNASISDKDDITWKRVMDQVDFETTQFLQELNISSE